MKRILAFLLTLAMLIGCMTAVSAMGENAGYPLLYETYEDESALDGFAIGGTGGGTFSIVEDGVNGSAGALHMYQTIAGKYTDTLYTTNGLDFEKGQSITVSLWVKMNSELNTATANSNQVNLIFYGSGYVTSVGKRTDVAVGDYWSGDGWKQYDISNKLVKDQWVKIEQKITWPDEMSIGSSAVINNITLKKFAIRVANQNGTNAVVDKAPLEYQIDDLVISTDTARLGGEQLLAEADYDTNATTGPLDGRSDDCSLPYYTKAYTVAEVPATYTQNNTTVENTSGYVYNKQPNVKLSANLRPGHMYKISGWYRVDADDTATDYVFEKAKLRLIFMGKDKTDANFASGSNYPSYYASTDVLEGQWTKIEYYFYMDYQMYATNPDAYIWLRLCPCYKYKGSDLIQANDHAIPGSFSYDNLSITDLGAPANGDMELPTNLKLAKNFVDTTQVIPGWTQSNSTIEAVTENGNTYAKYTSTGSHGSVKTAYAFENGKTYRISFRAKAESFEDGAQAPFTLILDRKTSKTGTNDAYTVSNYQYLQGDDKVSSGTYTKDQPWQITNQWQTFTTTYTTNFAVKSGMEETAETVNPRSAIIYPYIYNLDGTVSPKDTVVCLDDFVIMEESEALHSGIYAKVQNISVSGTAEVGKVLNVSYDYIPFGTETEDKNKTMIRAYIVNDGAEANIGTFSANESFTVPGVAYGKDIYFEVIPVSTTGGIGTSSVSAPVSVAKTNILTFAGDVAIAYSPEESAKILFATYTGKELTDVVAVDATFTNGKFTCDIPEELELGETMKVMMWKDLVNNEPLTTVAD